MSTPVYASMAPTAQDAIQTLLVKAAYYLQVAVEAAGGPSLPGMYANMSPSAQDTQQVLLVKLAYWASQVTGGTPGSGLAFHSGAGSPEGVQSGSPGDTYWDTSTGFYYVKVTGTATTSGWEIH